MTLNLEWIQRADKLWDAKCACGTVLTGTQEAHRSLIEVQHFEHHEQLRSRQRNGMSMTRKPINRACGKAPPPPPEPKK